MSPFLNKLSQRSMTFCMPMVKLSLKRTAKITNLKGSTLQRQKYEPNAHTESTKSDIRGKNQLISILFMGNISYVEILPVHVTETFLSAWSSCGVLSTCIPESSLLRGCWLSSSSLSSSDHSWETDIESYSFFHKLTQWEVCACWDLIGMSGVHAVRLAPPGSIPVHHSLD